MGYKLQKICALADMLEDRGTYPENWNDMTKFMAIPTNLVLQEATDNINNDIDTLAKRVEDSSMSESEKKALLPEKIN